MTLRAVFFVREVMPEGGLTLAAYRLATALIEAGGEAEVLYCNGELPAEHAAIGRSIPSTAGDPTIPADLAAALRESDPDVVVVGSGEREDLELASTVAPTLLHAHLHMGTCADTARFWSRLHRPCAVEAGWKCAAIRPVLGCNAVRETLNPVAVGRQKDLLRLLRDSEIGVLCVSTDQAAVYVRHGVPKSKVLSLPNLGIRLDSERLARAAAAVPPEWRSATVFVGRLSKTKGADLLPELERQLRPDSRLRVFGDGYLAPRLAAMSDDVLCGHVSQETVAGILLWARSFVFPSLWPEPGGIVGIDAQVMGVPLAAFDIGAGRHWPAAQRFERSDTAAMAAWLDTCVGRVKSRDPSVVAKSQAAYWSRIGAGARNELGAYADDLEFEDSLPQPSESLIVDG